MEKIDLKITDMSSQHCVKTGTDAATVLENIQGTQVNSRKDKRVVNLGNSGITAANLAEAIMKVGFEMMKNSEPLALILIGGILIMLFSITGCSDVPYTGQIVTAGHVDQYLDSIEQDTVCLQDGFDSVCVKLMLDEVEVEVPMVINTPIVHVHPASLGYVFHYEGKPILRAKKGMDTSELLQDLIDTGKVQLPSDINNLGNSGARNNDLEGWIIQIYYLDASPEVNRRLTLRNSGLDIRIVAGTRLLSHNRRDLPIQSFEQTDGLNGRRGVQFSVETKAPNITIQVGGLVPDHTAEFHISADGVESGEGTNILQLQPVQ